MDGHGLPLLSGPPPPNTSGTAEMGCRKCAKEFNILFTRSRRCNHCGYAYCNSCTDYQALMPRDPSAGQSGYDPMNVCAYCIEFLQITASGKGALKNLPLSKLRKYAGAYNIRIDHAVEKDDVIDALLAARQPNGCLALENEAYYRKYSVPNRSGPGPSSARARVQNLFSGSSSRNYTSSNAAPPPPPPQHTRPEFARPDLEPDGGAGREDRGIPIRPRMQPFAAASGAPPPRNTSTRPQSTPAASAPRPVPTPNPGSRPQSNYVPPHPPYSSYPSHPSTYPDTNPPVPPRGQQYHPSFYDLHVPPGHSSPRSGSVPPRTRASSAAPSTRTPPPPPPQPTPTLEELLEMTTESLSSLSIHTLKQILYANHVNTGWVPRLREEMERIERERAEREDEERIRLQHEMMEAYERERREKEERDREQAEAARRREAQETEDEHMQVDSEEGLQSHSEVQHDSAPSSSSSPPPIPPTVPTPSKTSPKATASAAFVERTDEEANIAIVDCGHLAMCRTCCDAIMHSTKECPLCRTRIVTEARLLRIFKA
ncbi:hypothetical protein EV360DRAFT_95759 [Lentinula raphanica]|nr:hypothetical protein EV360DRAFT_95759 [Lentinula raphanica]